MIDLSKGDYMASIKLFVEQNGRPLGAWVLCGVVGYVVGGAVIAFVSMAAFVGALLIVFGKP
jgi:hypothetical protein